MSIVAHPPASELSSALKRSRAALIGVALFSAVINILMLTGPLFMLQIYDRVIGSRSTSTLVVLFAIVVFLFAMMGLIDHFRGRVLARIGAGLQARLDERVLGAVLKQAEALHLRNSPSTALNDLAQIQNLFSSPALGAIFDLPWTPLFIAVLFLFHPIMGWFAIAGALVIFVLAVLNQVLTNRTRLKGMSATGEAEMRGMSMRKEIETVRGLGMRPDLVERWSRARGDALDRMIAAADIGGGITAATKAIRLLLQSAMLALGAWLVLQNMLTPGAMIAGSILLGRALAPVEQTVAQWPLIQRAMAARKTLEKLLAAIPEQRQPMDLPRPAAKIEASNLVVVPPGTRKPVLQGVRFAAQAGDAVAVIGPSASGKSSLARALIGLWHPVQGEIKLDGARLDQYDQDRLGRLMGYMPQDSALFAGTIAENIARFQKDAKAEDVVAAAQQAGAHDLILNLPQGYDTPVSDGGGELSGGQRQRIGLARAFYGDPVVLVLDEPNSNLDEEGVKALNQAIASARAAGRITFVMSHRPSALAECNYVLMIEAGQARAFGPRDEVLARLKQPAGSNVIPANRRG